MAHSHSHSAEGADKWTYISAGQEAILSLIANFFWVAMSVDLMADLEADTPIGISTIGAAVGALISVLASSGSVYCHYMLNLRHQESDEIAEHRESQEQSMVSTSVTMPLLPRADQAKLGLWQWMALGGDWFGHAGEFAATLSFILNIATQKEPLDRKIMLPIVMGLAVLGAIFSWADVRTCKQNLHDCNAKIGNAQTPFRRGINNDAAAERNAAAEQDA